jgi:hypothetical protein
MGSNLRRAAGFPETVERVSSKLSSVARGALVRRCSGALQTGVPPAGRIGSVTKVFEALSPLTSTSQHPSTLHLATESFPGQEGGPAAAPNAHVAAGHEVRYFSNSNILFLMGSFFRERSRFTSPNSARRSVIWRVLLSRKVRWLRLAVERQEAWLVSN